MALSKQIIILLCILIAGLITKKWWSMKHEINCDNIQKLQDVKKIAVIGCSGSGKTYVSFKLAAKLKLPIYHLDQYAWKPGWEKVDFEELSRVHHDLCQKDSWIIEGIYFKLLHERIEAADAIIFLNMPRYICIYNVIKRAIINHGMITPGNPEGCHQKIFSFKFIEFLQWIWLFNDKHQQKIFDALNLVQNSKHIYILKSMQEVNDFILKIEEL